MASIKKVASWYNDEIQDGIAWVAIWKNGRSWDAEAFWIEDGDYDDGYIFEREAIERMEEILKIDHGAIMINGYYSNVGTEEGRRVSVDRVVQGIEWNYYNHYNTLFHFFDGYVIK